MIEGRANVLPVQARDTRGNFFEVYILGDSINLLTISQVGEQHGCVRRSFLLIRKLESRRDSESEEQRECVCSSRQSPSNAAPLGTDSSKIGRAPVVFGLSRPNLDS